MPRIALLFPGQGAQHLGMGVSLVERNPAAKDYFSRASEVLGYDVLELCKSGPEDRLNATNFSQPALFTHSIAALADLLTTTPDLMESVVAVAGLSLGEYSAIAAAGGIAFEDGVRLVQLRGEAMQEAATAQASGMASVLGLTVDQVNELCDRARQPGEILRVANLLCPGNTAISGHLASLNRAEQVAQEMGAMKFIRLAVAGAFHTDLMKPAVEKLTQALSATTLNPLKAPLISNVDAAGHSAPDEFRNLLPRQVVSPVQWESSLRALIAMGVEQFYEIGAGRVLAGTLKRIDRKALCTCVGD